MTPFAILSLLFVALLLLWSGRRAIRALDRVNGADWGGPWVNRIDALNRLFCLRYHRLCADPVPLPAEGPALVAANHLSGLDPLLLAATCRRPLRFLIASEQYHRFGLTWLFRLARCIPVDRSGRPERALRQVVQALKAGEVVAIFPHGTIHLDSDPPRPLKPGVARLAQWGGCPVVPLRLEGIRGEGRILGAVWRRSRARLRAFPPIACDHLATRECLAAIAAVIEGKKAP